MLHDDSLAEELLDNDEEDGESKAGSVASDDAQFEALEASFFSGELNELTMSAMQQDLEAPCHSQLYTIGNGDTIQQNAVSPALHYACRGTRLRRLCALEYACLIKVEHQRARATPSQGDDDGLPENASFDFHPRHILCEDDYVQYLVSQSWCPIFAGKKLPVYPADDGSVKLKKNWATFVMCAFVPWDIECPPKLTWSAYVEWATHCQSEHASYLERSRLAMVKRIIRHGQYECVQKTIFDQVRKRNRKLWGVRQALDVQFDFEKEMQEMKDLKKDVQNTRFVEAVEDIQDAINRAQAEEKQENHAKEFDGICASLRGFLRTIAQPAVRHPMISVSCMTLMTTDNTRAVMTFTHMRNALPVLSSVRMKLLGTLLLLCVLHQAPQLTKVTHHKKQSYKPSLITSIWMHAQTSLADRWHPCCLCTLVEEQGKVGWHVKF